MTRALIGFVPFSILPGPAVTDRRQFANGLLSSLVHLAIQSLQTRRLPLFALVAGRPRLRAGSGFFAIFLAGFSRPTIAVESPLMQPIRSCGRCSATNGSCATLPRLPAANVAKAREKVASDSKEPAVPRRHILRRLAADCQARCRSLVVRYR